MQRYRVEVPTPSTYQQMVQCQAACPAGTNARAYVLAIARGEYARAYAIARQSNPFASICGRVCNAPCEASCRRGAVDAPVAIRALKRFVAEQFGVETPRFTRHHVEDLLAQGAADSVKGLDLHALGRLREARGCRVGKVAIVGAGPAGLSCAHDLALLGHEVHVFEAAEEPGGMLRYGIPPYRLPRDLLQAEIGFILSLGVHLHTGARLGRDFTLRDLREQGFEATFLAIGAHRGRALRVPGEDLSGVVQAVELLRRANAGEPVEMGQRVVVVGGGNAALDAARTARRLAGSGATVTVVYRRSRAEMPAAVGEVEEALREGVQFQFLANPVRLLPDAEGRRVARAECLRMRLGPPDASGRRRPEPIPGSEFLLEADTVVVAIGQAPDLSWLADEEGLEATRGGTLTVADADTLATSVPGVFAGGDVVGLGPLIAIQAVADGLRAARSIHAYLQGARLQTRVEGAFSPLPDHRMPEGYHRLRRAEPPLLPLDRRTWEAEVEGPLPREVAEEQARRCLQCHVQTVFHGDRCILCGGCVDVCPERCLKMVRLDRIEGDALLEAAVEARYGLPLAAFRKGWWPPGVLERGTAMIKDETRCIRCGLCARRCPTGAITMEAFRFVETTEVLDHE
ncbi:MAG: FAD-dependent oxidoreductase [Anaerolineae bacterium]